MRKSVVLVIAAALVATLAGCAPSVSTGGAGCTPSTPSGAASKLISAKGKIGTSPTVKFPTPVISKKWQTTTIHRGTGTTVEKGMIANVQVSLYLGKTGDLLAATAYKAGQALQVAAGVKNASTNNSIGKAVECQAVGSRFATVMTAKDFYGAKPDTATTGLSSSDTLILVVDVQKAFLAKANGRELPAQPGFPAVVTAPNGTPGITIPHTAAPTKKGVEVVRQGSGAVVKKGDMMVLHYSGLEWDTNTIFKTTWTDNAPVPTLAESITDNADATLDPTSAAALIGQRVGSQILVVVPKKFGYPTGKAPSDVPTDTTLVYVYDILGIE